MRPLIFILSLTLYIFSSYTHASSEVQFSLNHDNTVYGLKAGALYAYVDLSQDLSSLQSLSPEMISTVITKAALTASESWWKKPRFKSTVDCIIDVITITNKDEYAKADFNSAIRHGTIKIKREGSQFTLVSSNLNFTGKSKLPFTAAKK